MVRKRRTIGKEGNVFLPKAIHRGTGGTKLLFAKPYEEIITQEENQYLNEKPTKVDVKKTILELEENSASGPNGLTYTFYQACWEIVGRDIIKVVNAF